MHPALAKFILKRTPESILHPKPTMNTPFPLNTGATIPAVGLGTWQSPPGEVKNAVYHALKVGYRHIDCAFMYQNEDEVGKGIKEAIDAGIVKREDIFITTKLWCTYHSRVEEALDLSLSRLGLDYVDLYLMHWPIPMNPKGNHPLIPRLPDGSRDLDKSWSHVRTWKELEKLPGTGKAKAVGVANYSIKYLEELLPEASLVPAVNQVENHPLLPQQDLVDFCHAKGIHVTAYSPLGSNDAPLLADPDVRELAEKHKVGAGTILLSYHVARGNSVLPKSTKPHRIEENSKIIPLEEADLQLLNAIHQKRGLHRFVYPDFGVNLGFPDKQ